MRQHSRSIRDSRQFVRAFLFTFVLLPAAGPSTVNASEYAAPDAFVLLGTRGPDGLRAFARAIEAAGGHAAVLDPTGAAIVFADEKVLAHPAVRGRILGAWRGPVEPDALAGLDPGAAGAARAWNEALRLDIAGALRGEGQEHTHASAGEAMPDAGPRPIALGAGRPGPSLLASDNLPYGAQYYDTSEFLAGTVAVGVWLLESTTHVYDWTPAEESATLGGVQASLANWARKGGPPAALTFYLDVHTQVPVTGEPIEHPQSDDDVFANEVLGNLGWPGGNAFEKCFAYNNAIRDTFDTHWCYSIFIVDSDELVNQGLFSGGGYAWAYYGGPWVYMSRYSSWAYNPSRYAGVVPMHETGHIFMCTDEYNASLQYGGYLNIQDSPSSVVCIMNRNDSTVVCQPTRGQLGLWDSDGDGALDVMDVEPSGDLVPLPTDSTTDARPTWTGYAQVNRRVNLNPLSNYQPPHAQTIATIAAVEFRADAGPWGPAAADDGQFDDYGESFSWTPPAPLAVGDHLIECRARTSVGVWNTVYSGDSVTVVGLAAVNDGIPAEGFRLRSPRPNPARGPARISFRLPEARPVEIVVLDVAGRVVHTLEPGSVLGPGEHTIAWEGSDAGGRRLSAGLYLVRVKAGAETALGRLLLLR